ncbi:MAG: hypothetical protein ACYDGN_02755 [Acidimicrobiales bacterium]
MTQPKFAPIMPEDQVRELYRLPAPLEWRAHRPADFLATPGVTRPPGRGIAGPDQGYAMLLAERFAEQIRLAEGEHSEDVLVGAGAIAMRRASLYGRAPVSADLELGLRLFGYLGSADAGTIAARKEVFAGVGHDYWRQRELADLLPEATLRMTPAAITEELARNPDNPDNPDSPDKPAAFYELTGLDSRS